MGSLRGPAAPRRLSHDFHGSRQPCTASSTSIGALLHVPPCATRTQNLAVVLRHGPWPDDGHPLIRRPGASRKLRPSICTVRWRAVPQLYRIRPLAPGAHVHRTIVATAAAPRERRHDSNGTWFVRALCVDEIDRVDGCSRGESAYKDVQDHNGVRTQPTAD